MQDEQKMWKAVRPFTLVFLFFVRKFVQFYARSRKQNTTLRKKHKLYLWILVFKASENPLFCIKNVWGFFCEKLEICTRMKTQNRGTILKGLIGHHALWYFLKDLWHFTYKSVHRKSISRACGFTAQILRLQCYISVSWTEHSICGPEPFRCTRSLNRAIFETQNVYYSWASLKIIFKLSSLGAMIVYIIT